MRTTSPRTSGKSPTLPGTGDGSMVRPSRTTVKRLPAPPDPPATPNGGMMFLSPEHRQARRIAEDAHVASQPESAPELPVAARAFAQTVRLDPQRTLRLDHLGRLHGVEVALGECAHRVVAVGAAGRPGAGGPGYS